MPKEFNSPIKGMEANDSFGRQRARFIERSPETAGIIDELSGQHVSSEVFFRKINEFNTGRELKNEQKKDYLLLPGGRKLSIHWDDEGGVRLGGELSSEERENK
jgi:hypothetical protein